MAHAPGGILDGIGRALLEAIDFRAWVLLSLPVLLTLAYVNRRKNGVWPNMTAWMLAATGCLMIYSGFTVFCVFILTRPAYVTALSGDAFGFTALITAIAACSLGGREVIKLWKVPNDSKPQANPFPSVTSGQERPSPLETPGSRKAPE
jgi:hypothetical protein